MAGVTAEHLAVYDAGELGGGAGDIRGFHQRSKLSWRSKSMVRPSNPCGFSSIDLNKRELC